MPPPPLTSSRGEGKNIQGGQCCEVPCSYSYLKYWRIIRHKVHDIEITLKYPEQL